MVLIGSVPEANQEALLNLLPHHQRYPIFLAGLFQIIIYFEYVPDTISGTGYTAVNKIKFFALVKCTFSLWKRKKTNG